MTPWDAGTLQPPLKELIESKVLPLPTTGRALVPGCGKVCGPQTFDLCPPFSDPLPSPQGYDAICIAEGLGLETIGTDISSTALQQAEEWALCRRFRTSLELKLIYFQVHSFHRYDCQRSLRSRGLLRHD